MQTITVERDRGAGQRVEAAGGKLLKPKFAIGPFGFCARAIDPDGNTFGLHSMQ